MLKVVISHQELKEPGGLRLKGKTITNTDPRL